MAKERVELSQVRSGGLGHEAGAARFRRPKSVQNRCAIGEAMTATRRMSLAVMVAVLVFSGAVGSAWSAWAGTAGSDPNNGSWVGGEVLQPGPEQLVLWSLPGSGGRVGTCTTSNANGPLHGPYTVGSTVSDAVYGELNYLYAKAGTSDVRLAELSALNSHKYDEINTSEQWSYVQNGQGGTTVADANAMLATAQKLAGPYTVSITGLVQHGQGDRANTTYTATVHVVSANGTAVPSQVVSVSASGATLGASSVTTNSSGVASLSYSVPSSNATGSFSIKYSTDEHLTVDKMTSSGEQTMLSTGSPTAKTGSVSGGVDPLISIKWFKYTAGDPAKTPVAGAVFSKVVDETAGQTIATNLTSAATPSTLKNVIPGDTLVWTESKAPAGDYFTGPLTVAVPPTATDGYAIGLANPKKPSPTITTSVQLSSTQGGVRLVDRATVNGDVGENGTITDKLYSVSVPASGMCSGISDAQYGAGTLVGTFTAAVNGSNGSNGNGTYLITGPTATGSACFHWFESVELATSHATAIGKSNETTETTLVRPPYPSVSSSNSSLISAGYASTGSGPSWGGVAGGLGLTASGLLIGLGALRRRADRQPAA